MCFKYMLYALLLLRDGLFWFICCFQHPTQPSTIILQQTFHPPPNQVSFTRNFFITFIFKTLKVPENRMLYTGRKCCVFFRTTPSNSSRSYLTTSSSHHPTTPTTKQLSIPTYQQQQPPYNTTYWIALHCSYLPTAAATTLQHQLLNTTAAHSYLPAAAHTLQHHLLNSFALFIPTNSSRHPTTATTKLMNSVHTFLPTAAATYNTTYWTALPCSYLPTVAATLKQQLLNCCAVFILSYQQQLPPYNSN
jgi:hypothetical protein